MRTILLLLFLLSNLLGNTDYIKILESKKSGEYPHPFYKDKIITLVFYNTANKIDKIKKEITKEYRKSFTQQFDYALKAYNKLGENKQIVVQGVHPIAHNELQYDSNVILFNDKLLKNLPKALFVLMHEVGHSLDSQYNKSLEFYLNGTIENAYKYTEPHADTIAMIKTFQLLNKKGYTTNFSINLFDNLLGQASDYRINPKLQELNTEIMNNPYKFLQMNNKEIEDYATINHF